MLFLHEIKFGTKQNETMKRPNNPSPFPYGLDFFDALVFSASLAVRGCDGVSSPLRHLAARKRLVRHPSSPAHKHIQVIGSISRP